MSVDPPYGSTWRHRDGRILMVVEIVSRRIITGKGAAKRQRRARCVVLNIHGNEHPNTSFNVDRFGRELKQED